MNAFKQLKRHANGLMSIGYTESKSKPNLFYRSSGEITFFADMRGTRVFPVDKYPIPVIYWQTSDKISWRFYRAVKKELRAISEVCPYRIHRNKVNGKKWSYERGDYDEPVENGYCKICGKDLSSQGFLCSKECKKIARQRILQGETIWWSYCAP